LLLLTTRGILISSQRNRREEREGETVSLNFVKVLIIRMV